VGVLPLAPRFDTVGWLARDATTLARVGEALLAARSGAAVQPTLPTLPGRLLFPRELAAWLDPEAVAVFERQAAVLAARLGRPLVPVIVENGAAPIAAWRDVYLSLQNAEAAALHRAWIAAEAPAFGALIAGRIAGALAGGAYVDRAEAVCQALRAQLATLLKADTWMVWPSAAGAAPRRNLDDEATNAVTGRALTLGAPAGLAGLPQISLPLGDLDGCPFGISVVAPAGFDRALLALGEAAAPLDLYALPSAVPPRRTTSEEKPS
jgi:amidase